MCMENPTIPQYIVEDDEKTDIVDEKPKKFSSGVHWNDESAILEYIGDNDSKKEWKQVTSRRDRRRRWMGDRVSSGNAASPVSCIHSEILAKLRNPKFMSRAFSSNECGGQL